jgi:predicted transcriptional regulator
MRRILLSIKPEYVESILAGHKRYEFRKAKCRAKVDRIVIYATAPWMRVVGEADVNGVIEDDPEEVWIQTAEFSGISKDFFDQYYEHAGKAIAYQLREVRQYSCPRSLQEFGVATAPQSFVYLS